MHGLCTYGMTAKAMTDLLLDGDAAYGARFAGLLFPGETLEASIWRVDDEFIATLTAPSRDGAIVLSGVEPTPTWARLAEANA